MLNEIPLPRARPSVLRRMAVFIVGCALISAARAAVPGQINFQGKLLDMANNPRNGTFSFTFKIFPALTGGAALWSEVQSAVPVSNGVFSVVLGTTTPIPAAVFGAPTRWLEVTVGAQTGSPREPLLTVPYAFEAAAVGLPLPAGDTNYVQVRNTLQAGATFYVVGGTVGGPFVATGTVTLGGAAGLNDVNVKSNLSIAGRVRVPAGPGLLVSTSVFFAPPVVGGDNYVAYPFVASTVVLPKQVMIFTGPGTVGITAAGCDLGAFGVSVTSAAAGGIVYVAVQGVVTGVRVSGRVHVGDNLAADSVTFGYADDPQGKANCGAGVGSIGFAMTKAKKKGQMVTVFLSPFIY